MTNDDLGAVCIRIPQNFGRRLLVLLALSMLVLACDGSDTPVANGGMSGTGVSQGPITAFGSAYVNDVRWLLDGAAVEIDDSPGSESDLRVGMVVRIEGEISADGATGTATNVEFDDSVEGAITTISAPQNGGVERELSVLGQTVVIHETRTVYDDGASFLGLVVNDVIEVSGLVDDLARIRATRVERKGTFSPNASEGELRGFVKNLSKNVNGSGIFDLGPVVVRYTAATAFEDLTRDALAEDVFVEAKGTLRLAGELDATRIELEDQGLGRNSADKVRLRGFVSGFSSLAQPFEVAGVMVDGSSAVLDPSGFVVANGVEVEVEGPLVVGLLRAIKIESEQEGEDTIRIEAAVQSVDSATRSLLILGVRVRVLPATRLEDKRDDLPNFRFEDIAPGDWLLIRGVDDGDDVAIASQVRRDQEDDDVILQGPVTVLDRNAPSLSILDQPIPIHGGTQYRNVIDLPFPSAAAFFGAVDLGSIVKARDQNAVDAGVLGQADELDLEN